MLKTRERKRDRKEGGSEKKEGGKRGEKRVEARRKEGGKRGEKRVEAGRKRVERGWKRERRKKRAGTPAGMPALLCVLKRGSAY